MPQKLIGPKIQYQLTSVYTCIIYIIYYTVKEIQWEISLT